MAEAAVTADSWLRAATARLQAAGIDTARLDCLVLLEDATGRDRAWLLAHPEYDLPTRHVDDLNTKITQRGRHVPLAYIRGHSEFYGRTFAVDKRVLEPRPESEDIIELFKQAATASGGLPATIDVGTGSGALAITAKLEVPGSDVYASDFDPGCLEVAAGNANQLQAAITLVQADLLEPVGGAGNLPAPDIVLANLPYVPDSFQINLAAMHEPRQAIFGGPDGLDLYRRMFRQLERLPEGHRLVITEALPASHQTLAQVADAHGYGLQAVAGFAQLFARR